ncbi:MULTISPECIES: restriction endonuclease subunit S [Enterobacter cloacae complex]|uniref:Restriction endonuclease n=1 Tax=Enterobacter genomosp. O TaxID=2364150 RepID=A0A0X4EDR5_9ENTR|nr:MULTISPECIES: restriction endonuclease subunit S [Enterobacter cloacae complex]KUQ79865.1 restriction endonuclease [Enterobacter genomosp. O]MCM7110420.1 restriction endonuclease subunit S [Enterobacter cloacae]
MAKYKAYPEYKDSGVEWLGVIPKGWTISKVKYLAPFQVGWTPSTKNDANFIGDNLWVNISDLKDKFISSTAKCISDKAAKEASMDITPRGSLLYSFKLSVGAVSFAGCDLYTNEAIASFLDQAQLPLSYLYYALPIFIIENASTNIYGAKILNQELIKNSFLLAPSHSEAKKVAQFLDHETAKIDNLIEKQQQLIELLKEKRQAVISHAVTKGLNPVVPMKDSGVEWLGEVPEHWRVSRIKNYAKIESGHTPSRTKPEYWVSCNIPWVSLNDSKQLKEVDYIEDTFYKISELGMANSSAHLLPARAVVFTRDASIGLSAITTKTMAVSQHLIAWICDEKFIIPEFLLLVFYAMEKEFERYTFGATIKTIGMDNVRGLKSTFPPIEEQRNLIDWAFSKIEKIKSSINKVEDMLSLLQERRTALISAAVTGKIDVRDWVAPDTQNAEKQQEATA